MLTTLIHNVGALVAALTGVFPTAATANVNGVTIDRLQHQLPLSCVLHHSVGAATGAPATIAAQAKLQDSADGVAWADYVDPQTSAVAQTAVLAAGNADGAVAIDLSSARRFIRSVELVTLTGGNAPTLPVTNHLVLGGERKHPAI